jgi:hypothetical protein
MRHWFEQLPIDAPSVQARWATASEQKRPDVREARRVWITQRQPFMRNLLPRIGFIDETSLKTNIAKTTGWAPKGARLMDHVPVGHWSTQTFIAALRHDRLDAPWVIDGPPLVHVNKHCRAVDEPRAVRSLRQNAAGSDFAAGRRDHSPLSSLQAATAGQWTTCHRTKAPARQQR